MNKKRIKKIIIIMMILCLLGLLYSIINIAIWYVDNQKNSAIQKEVKEIINNSGDSNNVNDENKINFTKLKEINNEVVAYLKVNNTNIDYVVVRGSDNKYYLRHNLNKEYNRAGWIFMDYHNKLDGLDRNIVIYGHNTMDGTMFGTLKNIVKEEWYTNPLNYKINLVMEDKTYTYQVFSTYSIKVEDYYINTIFKNNSEFKTFIDTLKKRSVYDYNVSVNEEDSILTLSTCTGNGKSRMVLHAKRINEENF